MEVSLPPAIERFVVEKVREGLYQSESEVISDALRQRFRESPDADKLARLRGQLGEVEVQIKEVLNQIARWKLQEEGQEDCSRESQARTEAIMRNLQKAADAYSQLLQATSLL